MQCMTVCGSIAIKEAHTEQTHEISVRHRKAIHFRTPHSPWHFSRSSAYSGLCRSTGGDFPSWRSGRFFFFSRHLVLIVRESEQQEMRVRHLWGLFGHLEPFDGQSKAACQRNMFFSLGFKSFSIDPDRQQRGHFAKFSFITALHGRLSKMWSHATKRFSSFTVTKL